MRDWSRMRRNGFDHAQEISEQEKTGYWIAKSARFNMICVTSNISPGVYCLNQTEKAYTSTKTRPRLSRKRHQGFILQQKR
jgi:hypothetical protein